MHLFAVIAALLGIIIPILTFVFCQEGGIRALSKFDVDLKNKHLDDVVLTAPCKGSAD